MVKSETKWVERHSTETEGKKTTPNNLTNTHLSFTAAAYVL